MNCAEVEKHLSEYLDNETASDMRQQIAAVSYTHLGVSFRQWPAGRLFLY